MQREIPFARIVNHNSFTAIAMRMEHYMTEIGSVALSQDGNGGTPTEQDIVS